MDLKKAEDEVLDFWKKNKIYSKVRDNNSKGKKFYFMDGPPYATGHIHMGTALNKILKDIAMRYKTLQGFDVFDRPGYDTHGLPIEFQVEKEIGSKSKKDIEKYGVKKFVEKCKEYATKYIGVMNDEFMNLGVWMNWDDPYLSLDDEYIEAVWHVLKKADEKNLLYLGKYPVHLCPRCETAVAYNEIEYTKQSDNSVYVKFPVKGKKNEFLVIWTTTPWTLPANTGIMVHPEFSYSEIEVEGEKWIIASELVDKVMTYADKKFKKIKEVKGKELEGLEYENPLAKHTQIKVKKGNRVVLSGRYVTLEDGTGLVHVAPGHGKEDFDVGRDNDLDMFCPVKMNGEMSEEAGKYAGKKAREVDSEIIADLEKGNAIVFKMKYSHDYPICWRCKSPLLMVSLPQWFLKILDIHNKLLKENEETKWVPDYMKLRMKAWLEGIGDWPISRERYWGTPLPIWMCDCGEKKVIGSISELQKLSGKKKIELHKPGIDSISWKCKCGKEMKRISAVLDVWFDSGASSWAALRYPDNREEFEKYWPADFNIEGTDQFRGWWNSQLILSVIGFDRRPFENIAVHGMVLDVEKKKMSKSLGNVTSPKEVIEKYGRDYMRYYFAKLSRGEDFAYDEREFKDIGNFFRVLVNINNFVNQIESEKGKADKGKSNREIEDLWILSKYNNLVAEVMKSFDDYRFYEAVTKIERFLVQDLSRNYIQMIRDRSDEVKDILEEIRLGLIKMLAPVTPFVSEKIWLDLKSKKNVKENSLFLSEWPAVDKKAINLDLEEDFEVVLKIIETGLAERDKNKIGLKWPLAKATVKCYLKLNQDLSSLIGRQLNVKKVDLREQKEIEVALDLKMTEELEAEGFAREIARRVQAERKNRGLEKKDKISLKLSVDSELRKKLESQKELLADRVGAKKLEIVVDKIQKGVEFKVRENRVTIQF